MRHDSTIFTGHIRRALSILIGMCCLLLTNRGAAAELPATSPAAPSTTPSTTASVTTPDTLPSPTDEAEQQYAFATGLYARKLYPEAVAEYRRFLTSWPTHPRAADAHLFLGEALFSTGQFEAARRSFASFLQSFPQHPRTEATRVRMAACLFQLKQYDKTIEALASLKNLPEPHASACHYYRGRSLQETGHPAEAMAELAKALTNPEVGGLARFSLGELALQNKNFDDALACFSAFLSAHPHHRLVPAAMLRQAEALRGKKEWARALAAYNALSDAATANEKMQAQYGAGWCLLALDKAVDAEKQARALIALNAVDLKDGTYFLLGQALMAQKKYLAAAEAFGHVAAGTHQEDAACEYLRACLLGEDYDAVISGAPSFLKQYPQGSVGPASYFLGLAYFRKEQYAQAVAPLMASRAVTGHVERADAAWYVAMTQDQLKNPAKAVDAWRFFVTTFPAHERLNEALQGLVQALVVAQKDEEAMTVARQLLAQSTVTSEQRVFGLRQIAACAFNLKQYVVMQESYQALLKEVPAGPAAREARYWLAWSAQNQGKYAEAAAAYQLVATDKIQDDFSKRARYRHGMCAYQAGNFREAADVFYGILTTDPTIEIGNDELLWLGGWFVRAQEVEKANGVYEALLKLTNNPAVVAMALYQQAEIRRGNKKWKEAAEKYHQLLAHKDATFTSLGWFGLGVCQRELGQIDEAALSLSKVQFDPADPMTGALAYELGALAEIQQKHELALRHYMRVAVLYDDAALTGKALYAAAMLYQKMKQIARARQCLAEICDTSKNGFATRHPDSPWIAKAALALAALDVASKSTVIPASTHVAE